MGKANIKNQKMMKTFLVFVSYLFIANAKPFFGRSATLDDVICTESVDGYPVFIPHPTECNLYYMCAGLTPVLMSCPGELFFDPSLNVCNWPDQVDCQAQTEEETTEAGEEEGGESGEEGEESSSEEGSSSESSSEEGSSSSSEEGSEEGNEEGSEEGNEEESSLVQK